MTLRDIFWPWGALREARHDMRYWQDIAARRASEAEDLRIRWKLQNAAQAETIKQLRELARKGAYHDPKTGRMMKRGAIPAEYKALVDGASNPMQQAVDSHRYYAGLAQPNNTQFGLAASASRAQREANEEFERLLEKTKADNATGDKS